MLHDYVKQHFFISIRSCFFLSSVSFSFGLILVIIELHFSLSTAADSQESGSPPPSPTDSTTSEPPPTLVHIKQEMPPGGDNKEYYGAIDFALPDTYLPSNLDYGRYLPRSLDFKEKFDQKDDKEDSKDNLISTDYSLSKDYDLPNELALKAGGIFARRNISSGTRYGPFIGKWVTQPLDRRFAWEVSVFQFSMLDLFFIIIIMN